MTRKKAAYRYPTLRAYLDDLSNQGGTQADFAARMDMSEGYLSDLKNGHVRPSLSLAKRLADECGIPIESFLTSDEDESQSATVQR